GRLAMVVAVAATTGTVLAGSPVPAVARPSAATLSETSRLAERRFAVIGDHAYEVGAADARYPATGWHIRGEMGGFWTPPVKLLDGLWFAVDGQWLTANRFTSSQGYVQLDLAGPGGLRVRRTDFAPDGGRATLVGLTFTGGPRHVALTVDAHSELMPAYPWGWTNPGAGTFNLPDSGGFDGRALVFR